MDPILERLTDEASADRAFAERLDQFLADSLQDAQGTQRLIESLGLGEGKPNGFMVGLTEFHWNPSAKTIPNFRGHKLIVDRSAQPKPRAALFVSALNERNCWRFALIPIGQDET